MRDSFERLKDKYPYYNETFDVEERIDLIMKKLQLFDKFKLLSGRHFSLWVTKPILRLKIPSLGMTDGPNGVAFHSSLKKNTKFPNSKCLSSTWNRELAKEYGIAIAKEVRASKRHILLAPGINIDRTPMNGRTFEYFSEDPYLTREIGSPFVEGIQSQRIGACLKHYVANNQETNRFTMNSVVDERTLHEIYLRAFRDIVLRSNPWVVMGSYNKINGIRGCAHKELLRDTLMDKWGFKGYVVTDWFATRGITKPEDCIKAGLSLEMPIPIAYKMFQLRKAYKQGKFTIEELDDVVRRLLRVMFYVGLFDNPESIPQGERNTTEIQNVARRIAEEGIILLKNENEILPLDIDEVKTIAVLGPNKAKKFGKLLYGGSAAVISPYEITPEEGLKKKLEGKVEFTEDRMIADYCIIFAGLDHSRGMDCESIDRDNFELPEEQIQLIKETVNINPNTIVVLLTGSPVPMIQWIDNVPAIVEAWYPGMEGGLAIADILFGDINPSGKLPITFPKELSDSPAHKSEKTFPGDGENVLYEEGLFVGYRHFDQQQIEPQFPFGYGLSYTSFEYSNLKLANNLISKDRPVTISIDLTNTGERAGSEIVQLYISANESPIIRPPKELKNFTKVHLEPSETKTVDLQVSLSDLIHYDSRIHNWTYGVGTYTVRIGSSSHDIKFETLVACKP